MPLGRALGTPDETQGWLPLGEGALPAPEMPDVTSPGVAAGSPVGVQRTNGALPPGWHDPTEGMDDGSEQGLTTMQEAGDIGLAGLMAGTDAVSIAGSLVELVIPEAGEAIRQSGQSMAEYLQSNMSPEYQEAMNAQWATLDSSEAGWASRKAWLGQLARNLPTLGMTGVLGLGVKGALIARGATEAAAGLKAGTIVGGTYGAGEAAQGAGQAADEAGLSTGDKWLAQITAAPVGAVSGAVLGHTATKVLGGQAGGVIRGTGAVIAGQGIEEAGTQTGTELGKVAAGLPADPGAILEAGVAGTAIGLPAGAALSVPGKLAEAKRARTARAETEAADAAEKQALADERDRVEHDQTATAESLQQGREANAAAAMTPQDTTPMADWRRKIAAQTPLPQAQQTPAPMAATPFDQDIQATTSELAALEYTPTNFSKTPKRAAAARQTGRIRTAKARLESLNNKRMQWLADNGNEVIAAARERELNDALDKAGLVDEDTSVAPAAPPADAIPGQLPAEIVTKPRVSPTPAGNAAPAGEGAPKKLTKAQAAKALSRKRSDAAVKGAQTKAAKRAAPAATPAVANSAEQQAVKRRQPLKAPPLVPAQQAAMAPEPPPAPALDPLSPEAAQTKVLPLPTAGGAPSTPAGSEPGVITPPEPIATQPVRSGVRRLRPTSQAAQTAANAQAVEPLPPEPPPPLPSAADTAADFLAYRKKKQGVPPPPAGANADAPLYRKRPPARGKSKTKQAPMTTGQSLLAMLRKGPQSATMVLDMLHDIYAKQTSDGPRRVTVLLRNAFAPGNEPAVQITKLSNGFQGFYNPQTDTIHVDPDNALDLPTVVLHELIHAAVEAKVRTNKNLEMQLKAILNEAEEAWISSGRPMDPKAEAAFAGPTEFLATALSDTGFADALGSINHSASTTQIGRLISWIGSILGFRGEAGRTKTIYNQLMDFVADDTFTSEPNRKQLLKTLNELGIADPVASLDSMYRSWLRKNAATRATLGMPKKIKGVRRWSLGAYSNEQIARSFGKLGKAFTDQAGNIHPLDYDVINQFEHLSSGKSAYAAWARVTSSQVAEYMKNAADPVTGNKPLDDLMVNAHLWALDPDPDLPINPRNLYGLNQPGAKDAWAELTRQWGALTDKQKNAYRLVRDIYGSFRDDMINQMTLARLRMATDGVTADKLNAVIYDQNRQTAARNYVPGIEIKTHPPLSPLELKAALSTLGVNPDRIDKLYEQLMEVNSSLGESKGPYFPMRRNGDYFSIVKSKPFTTTLTPAQLEKLVTDDRAHGGTLLITRQNPTPGGNFVVTYHHEAVSAWDTADEADEALAYEKKMFDTAPGGAIPIDHMVRKLRRDVMYEAAGLQAPQLNAMIAEMRQALPGKPGEMASTQLVKFWLERLPDTSIHKSRMRSRKVARADRDMLHVFSAYAQGASYFAAQMRFGHRIAKALGPDTDHDIKTLQKALQFDQADDLRAITDHLRKDDKEASSLAARDITDDRHLVTELWQRIPSLMGAWYLTGIGTMIANATQPIMVAEPHFTARFGKLKAGAALLGAYWDVTGQAFKAAGAESLNVIKPSRIAGAATALAKGNLPQSLKDPSEPFFRKLIKNLTDPGEKDAIEQLTQQKKIEYGLVADLQSMARKQGKVLNLFTYLSEAAFIWPQAAETLNRTVTALASYRLNKQKYPDKSQEELIATAARDIDQTQGNYDHANKPAWMKKEQLRPAMVFKTYPQLMFYTIGHNLVEGFGRGNKPSDPVALKRWQEERSIARKFIGGLAINTMLASGLVGVVAYEPFYWACVALMSMFSDDDDPEQVLRDMMADFPPMLRDFITSGAPRAIGLADTSRLGVPQLFPSDDLKTWALDNEPKKDMFFSILGETLAGVPGSFLSDSFSGASYMIHGEPEKAMTMLMPKFAQLNDVARVYKYMSEGVKNSAGYTAMQPEEMTIVDLIVRGLGFEPASVADLKTKQRSYYRLDREAVTKRTGLMRDFTRAQLDGDREGRDEALAEIMAFNKANPARAIKRKDLAASQKGRAKSDVNVARYGVNAQSRAQRALAEEIDARY